MGGKRLHWWILGGMIGGGLLGAALNYSHGEAVTETQLYAALDGLATIFLKLLKMIVIPLVFFSLASGMVGLGSLRYLGRMGAKTFGMYLMTSMLAILTGLVMVNTIRPGVGLTLAIPTEPVDKTPPGSVWEVIANMVPDNPIASAANFDLIGVIIFALFFGAFLLTLQDDRKSHLIAFVEAASELMMNMTRFVISLAPVGIAALVGRMVATVPPRELLQLVWYILTVLAALGFHAFVTLPLLIWLFTRRNPYRFMKAMSPALMTGFSTASSSGTLGVTMERIEKHAGVSNRVASFVLPLGATVNMDGTALYEIVTVLFIAQLHAANDPTFVLTFGQQLLIVFLGLAVSIGAAGIPHAGLVMMVIILQAVGLPIEYTGLIWAVDRLLDMGRTAVNITSDSTVALLVAHSENEFSESIG